MTMSKFIIVCFIVLAAASAIHGAPRKGRNIHLNTIRALKDECIRGIQSTYIEAKRRCLGKTIVDPSPENNEILRHLIWNGFVEFHKIVGKVHEAPSINSIETREIFGGFPVSCEPEVLTDVTFLIDQLMEPNKESVIKV